MTFEAFLTRDDPQGLITYLASDTTSRVAFYQAYVEHAERHRYTTDTRSIYTLIQDFDRWFNNNSSRIFADYNRMPLACSFMEEKMKPRRARKGFSARKPLP